MSTIRRLYYRLRRPERGGATTDHANPNGRDGKVAAGWTITAVGSHGFNILPCEGQGYLIEDLNALRALHRALEEYLAQR